MPNATDRNDMSVGHGQLDADLQAAEHALEAAMERRSAAEHALWGAVGKSSQKRGIRRVAAAREEVAEADLVLKEAEALVTSLRQQELEAQAREARLLAITDMLIAGDEARRSEATNHGNGDGNGQKRRSLLDRLLRR
jgi:hypothetical protein